MSMASILARLGGFLFLLIEIADGCTINAPHGTLCEAWEAPGDALIKLGTTERSRDNLFVLAMLLYPIAGILLGAAIGWVIDRLRKRVNAPR